MTLILSLVNPDQVVVVADRRLTRVTPVVKTGDGEEGTNKGFLLTCDDARMVVTFTGLAEAGSFITRKWLLETLMKIKAPDHRICGIVRRLAEEAKVIEKLRIAPEDRRLSIAMAGYIYDAHPPRGAIFHVTNFDPMDQSRSTPLDKAQGHFEVDLHREPGSASASERVGAVLAIGDDRSLREEDLNALAELVMARKSIAAITNRAVHAIRSAATRSRTVGRECMSLTLPSDPAQAAESHFHPDGPVQVSYGFGSVDLRSDSVGLIVDSPEMWAEEADGAPILLETRPRKQSRNALCACGSGKKYKKCCGR